MWFGRVFWFGAGALAGVLASQLLANPEGRELVKRALMHGYSLRDLLMQPVERLQEDVNDLVAEAREEHEHGVSDPRSVDGADRAQA